MSGKQRPKEGDNGSQRGLFQSYSAELRERPISQASKREIEETGRGGSIQLQNNQLDDFSRYYAITLKEDSYFKLYRRRKKSFRV